MFGWIFGSHQNLDGQVMIHQAIGRSRAGFARKIPSRVSSDTAGSDETIFIRSYDDHAEPNQNVRDGPHGAWAMDLPG